MRDARAGPGWKSWRVLVEAGSVAGLADGMLLERFLARRDDVAEVAFAALVARHGPMVRRVCRRLLVDPNDAEDAFQATFLVLARRAGAIRSPERLSSWLYGTAHRSSRKLKAQSARRRRHELEAAREESILVDDPGQCERTEAVLEEVARLPRSYKAAVVLCELEGLTQGEAARLLGLSERTVGRHLVRARSLLRIRLTRRGLAPTATWLASALAPESASAAVPEGIVDATARAATRFAAGMSKAGAVPASAVILAEGVIQAMFWTKLKGIAVASGLVMALGVGAGIGAGFASPPASAPGDGPVPPKREANAIDPRISPAEEYQALVKRYDGQMQAYHETVKQEAAKGAMTREDLSEIWQRFGPFTGDHAPAFVALAERYPGDPAALDALLWVAEKSASLYDGRDDPIGLAVARAFELIARNHPDEPRLGPLCRKLIYAPSPRRDVFLEALSERSPDRVVKGRATLARAEYLKMKGDFVAILRRGGGDHVVAGQRFKYKVEGDFIDTLESPASSAPAPRVDLRERYGPVYLKELRASDPVAILRESERLYVRVLDSFGDVPNTGPDGQPTRETLADVVRRSSKPGPTFEPEERFKALAESFRAAERMANEASEKAGRGKAGFKAYIAAFPKWADFGPKMWELAEGAPRSPAALDALLWILRHHVPFFDDAEERARVLGRAVDVLIRDHLDFIGDNLAARNVSDAFNNGSPMRAPHIDRLYRALYERGRTREIRGRMGLALARHLKGEADLAESLDVRGADPARRPEIVMWDPAYIRRLRRKGRLQFDREAEVVFERVKADYGDIPYLNGTVLTDETLAVVADRELSAMRTLAVGQAAPGIEGEDVDGKPMTLAEFRGKVVLLDFGSHEHCGGCRLVYPRLRTIVDQYRGRPLVVLGVNNNDRRDILGQLKAKGEVTWRCWWDGDREDGPGPITSRWNIRGYPTFIVLDHQGVIRFKDLHPDDVRGFDEAIEPLVKQAEMEAARR